MRSAEQLSSSEPAPARRPMVLREHLQSVVTARLAHHLEGGHSCSPPWRSEPCGGTVHLLNTHCSIETDLPLTDVVRRKGSYLSMSLFPRLPFHCCLPQRGGRPASVRRMGARQ